MSELVLTNGEVVDYDPVTPIELEFLIQELGKRLESAVPVIKQLWKARYDAERTLIEEKAKAVTPPAARDLIAVGVESLGSEMGVAA